MFSTILQPPFNEISFFLQTSDVISILGIHDILRSTVIFLLPMIRLRNLTVTLNSNDMGCPPKKPHCILEQL